MDGEEAINETAKGKTVTTTTSTTIAAVHGTGPAAPRMRAKICSIGSTISGHVTASADNVHPRAAVGRQRRTFIRRSSRTSNGCTKKNAPHTTDIPQRPSKLDPVKGDIIRLLAQHAYSAQQLYQQLKERG